MCIKPAVDIELCGRVDYRSMWERQLDYFHKLIDSVKAENTPDEEKIFLVEHDAVYTLGKHGKDKNLLVDTASLRATGTECIRIERGGDITYHGPGQLVVYPILYLKAHNLGVKKYIELLEEAVIIFLKQFGVKGQRVEGATGVWIDAGSPRERKICAIGVKCSHFVTMHGLALNLNTDLSNFKLINPCGFTDKGVTSLSEEIGKNVDFEKCALNFGKILKRLLEGNE